VETYYYAHRPVLITMGVRTKGSADPPGKWMKNKLKSENIQKRAVFYIYVIF